MGFAIKRAFCLSGKPPEAKAMAAVKHNAQPSATYVGELYQS
jgi:hypothetical protein